MLFNKLVGDQAKRFANIESSEWLQCFRTNSTYLDCPIAQHNAGNTTFVVAVMNPMSDFYSY